MKHDKAGEISSIIQRADENPESKKWYPKYIAEIWWLTISMFAMHFKILAIKFCLSESNEVRENVRETIGYSRGIFYVLSIFFQDLVWLKHFKIKIILV